MYIAKELAQQHLVSTSKMRGKSFLDSFSYFFFPFQKLSFVYVIGVKGLYDAFTYTELLSIVSLRC